MKTHVITVELVFLFSETFYLVFYIQFSLRFLYSFLMVFQRLIFSEKNLKALAPGLPTVFLANEQFGSPTPWLINKMNCQQYGLRTVWLIICMAYQRYELLTI